MSENLVAKYEEIANHVRKTADLQKQLGLVRGLISNSPQNYSINVLYEDKNQPYRWTGYGSERDAWKSLVSEVLSLATPILGAVETSLREQIRKEKFVLENLGVTDI